MDNQTAKTIVRAYFHRLLNEHDLAVCDQLLAPEYLDHDAPAGTPPGPGSTKAFVAALIDEYPDIQVQMEDMLAEAQRVAARLHGEARIASLAQRCIRSASLSYA
jgi:predicted SnoaL-like aldol condensation-catalyzing enzyme